MYHAFGEILEEVPVSTPFADLPVMVQRRSLAGNELFFLSRHGEDHSTVAHQVNYRANVYAFKELHVSTILAGCTVGAIDRSLDVGDIVIPDQIIDFTMGRKQSFELESIDEHFDFTEPFSESIRQILIDSIGETELRFARTGTMVVCDGPRFETRAEIDFYHRVGGTIVGMTAMPEAALARQIGIEYGAFSPVVNMAAGIKGEVHMHELKAIDDDSDPLVLEWFESVVGLLSK